MSFSACPWIIRKGIKLCVFCGAGGRIPSIHGCTLLSQGHGDLDRPRCRRIGSLRRQRDIYLLLRRMITNLQLKHVCALCCSWMHTRIRATQSVTQLLHYIITSEKYRNQIKYPQFYFGFKLLQNLHFFRCWSPDELLHLTTYSSFSCNDAFMSLTLHIFLRLMRVNVSTEKEVREEMKAQIAFHLIQIQSTNIRPTWWCREGWCLTFFFLTGVKTWPDVFTLYRSVITLKLDGKQEQLLVWHSIFFSFDKIKEIKWDLVMEGWEY